MHLVGFTIGIYYDARLYERQKRESVFFMMLSIATMVV